MPIKYIPNKITSTILNIYRYITTKVKQSH
jgi:hypothetical protein